MHIEWAAHEMNGIAMGKNQVNAGRKKFVDVDVDVDVKACRARGGRAARRAFGLRACGVGLMLLLPVAGHAQVNAPAPTSPIAPNVSGIPRAGQAMRDLETARPELPVPSRVELDLPKAEDGTAPAASAAPAAPGMRLKVQGFRIDGNKVFDSAQLLPLLGDLNGSEQDLAGLRAAADRITAYYHEHGYLLARAFLPPQDIEDGMVRLEVMEGRYGRIVLQNKSRAFDGVLRQPLSKLRSGEAVHSAELESSLLLLNDIPGAEAKGTLQSGTDPGTTDLLVEAQAGPLAGGSLEADNYGGYYTGEYRLGGSFYLNNPLRLGDQLSLRVLGSDKRQRYYRAGYQLPAGPWSTRVGVSYSDMSYHLGKVFSVLEAHGRASIRSVFVSQPLLRGRAFNLSAQLQYDDKRLRDQMDVFETNVGKRVGLWTAGVNGNGQDNVFGGGQTMFSVSYSTGRLRIDDPLTEFIDQISAKAGGSFSKMNLSAARLQRLSHRFQLYAQANAQWAAGNLDGSEKFGMGGPYGVRAYALGAGSGDQGWQASLELRYAVAPGWQLSAFMDKSVVDINKQPWTRERNTRRLTGAGIGGAWAGQGHQISLALAWPLGQRDLSGGPVRSPRFWVQGAQYF
ncbi:Hemolysin activation/secretion protein associated with VreARI signaling system [Cupriavidus basilensis]|uniref:Hemolysin activation/secretion protein associated with VreARI signaling system n=2 Tax=Cupriavidus basilensis TaxID=68895 RepID=A0A0C4YCG9_9BURK|nr:Hemolysin activation/secretion protein associated with VreARI signaling system [Cupriavidus basilensis]